jgi:hypothetical protein
MINMLQCTSEIMDLRMYYNLQVSEMALCYRHNLARPEGGPRARWAQRINVINLRIGLCVSVCRAELAMYLV